jgi:hypothetical protein
MDLTEAEVQRVERTLARHVICRRCNATLATYAERCNVPLDEPCEGFRAVEMARKPIAGTA